MTNKKFWDDYPEPIKSRAIANYERFGNLHKSEDDLRSGFLWNLTPEKGDFWGLVYKGQYDEALALLKEEVEQHESKEVEDLQAENSALLEENEELSKALSRQAQMIEDLQSENEPLKAENEALKRTIREGVQNMRMKVWNDTFQNIFKQNAATIGHSKTAANMALEEFDKTFNTQKEQV